MLFQESFMGQVIQGSLKCVLKFLKEVLFCNFDAPWHLSQLHEQRKSLSYKQQDQSPLISSQTISFQIKFLMIQFPLVQEYCCSLLFHAHTVISSTALHISFKTVSEICIGTSSLVYRLWGYGAFKYYISTFGGGGGPIMLILLMGAH